MPEMFRLRSGSSPADDNRRSRDRVSEGLHTLFKNSLRELSRPANKERAKVFVPVPVGSYRTSANPRLESEQIANRDAPFIDSLQQVVPDAAGKIRKLNLRQLKPSRRLL